MLKRDPKGLFFLCIYIFFCTFAAFFEKTVPKMANVQDKDKLYSFLRPYVDWTFRLSYRHFQLVGKENIPTDGVYIYAPNHTNALCDAMAILGIDHQRKVFVARADIFRKPKQAKILNWLKIMPIRRVRDGLDEVRRNDETIEKAVATLHEGVPFCILPEGAHRTKHSLLPLGKGIFRIALQANEEFGAEKPVYIVPVGLEYGDWFHLWNNLTVNIGKPINVTEFAKAHSELEYPQLILALRAELTQRMQHSFMWVPDDDRYDDNWAKLAANPPALYDRFKERKLPKWLLAFYLLALSPLFVTCAALTIPLWAMWLYICHKVADPAFHNSVQYVWQTVYYPLTLFTAIPLWMFVQEYVYQYRRLRK